MLYSLTLTSNALASIAANSARVTFASGENSVSDVPSMIPLSARAVISLFAFESAMSVNCANALMGVIAIAIINADNIFFIKVSLLFKKAEQYALPLYKILFYGVSVVPSGRYHNEPAPPTPSVFVGLLIVNISAIGVIESESPFQTNTLTFVG